jgi:TonB family protein
MSAHARSPSARELKRLLYFAAASAALHALTLAIHVSYGPGRVSSAPPLVRTLQARLVPPSNGAIAESEQPQPAVDPNALLQPQRPEPPAQQGGNPDAPRLPTPDRWYTASELDVRAEPLTPVEFAYPPKLERLIARVEIALFIDERGEVRKAEVLSAEPEKLFDEAALNGWRNVRFSPAMRHGVAVKSQKLVQVDFQP